MVALQTAAGTDILEFIDASLITLFSSAFLSATLLPGGSELLLIYLAQQESAATLSLWSVATSGNTLGGMTNWLLGMALLKGLRKRRNKEKPDSRATAWLRKYGSPALLLAWLPVIGDPLCLAAGWLGIHWLPALIFIAIGKGIRYGLILAAV